MRKNTLQPALTVSTIVLAIIAFYTISRAIKIPEASTWIVPILWVSLLVISLFFLGVFTRNRMSAEITVAASLLLSLIFAFTLVHFVISVVCIFLILSGLRAIKGDLDLNVKINLWKSLYVGKFKVIFAIALLISSQYYFTAKSMKGPVNVPKFDVSGISMKIVGPMLGIINPEFAEAGRQDLTVDQFIIQSQSDSLNASFGDDDSQSERLIDANLPSDIPAAQKEMLKQQALTKVTDAKSKLLEQNRELVLLEGRRQFSKIVGRNVEGNEKISDVFAGMVNDKINSYFQPNVDRPERSTLFPFVLTLILFATIWPLGSLLSTIWFAIIILIFKILVKYGFIEVKKVMVEREIIE